jgi:hypothetical protein
MCPPPFLWAEMLMIFSAICEMAAGILPESLIVLYHGERLRRKTAKNTGASAPVFFVLAM